MGMTCPPAQPPDRVRGVPQRSILSFVIFSPLADESLEQYLA